MASNVQNELKIDFMLKRSQNKTAFTKENYKSRWFVLEREAFKYYDGTLEKRGKYKGGIQLRDIKTVEKVDDYLLEERCNVFQIVYTEDGNFYTLYVVANNDNQKKVWIQELRKAAMNNKAEFIRKYHKGVWTRKQGKYNCCQQISRGAEGCEPSFIEIDRLSKRSKEGDKEDRSPSTTQLKTANGVKPQLPARPAATLQAPEGELFISMFDYAPNQDDDLELVKGQEYVVIGKPQEYWWLARDGAGRKGYVPSNYLRKKHGLEIYDWYHKDMSRQQTESLLSAQCKEGTFLVRDSATSPGTYTLSLFTNENMTRHYHIKKNDTSGEFYVAEKHSFPTIPELIHYHKHNAGGLAVRLRSSPQRDDQQQPPTAGFSHNKFEIDPSELTMEELLGAGCFGSVHKGKWRGRVVAVKMMKENTMSEEDFIDEAKVMTQLNHPNLVQLYGIVTKKKPLVIISELMKFGSLQNYLKRHKGRFFQRATVLLDFCMQVCKGMEYLEKKKFIHRDLATRNCLVGESSVIKVADFGLARHVIDDEYTSSNGAKFPIKWAPPEVIKYTRFSSKSDVWAFGILMWEVFTCGDMPYGNLRNQEVVDYILDRRGRLTKPPNCPEPVYTVMRKSWKEDADARPAFSQLLRILSGLLDTGNYPHV